ncbi:MAG TPA: TetR/AcrR family transcriptional regulator [Acidimicrobiales bacterium]|nr:TetR/AcrR family transcriptional regulator [Acidimicrobiales bacterium]
MRSTGSSVVPRLGSTPYSAAQLRTATAALDLFAAHGVSGTSLQMIADATGVTKAAVYHQFKTKDAIVVAAVDVELGRLEPALEAAEASDRSDIGEVGALLGQVIDLAIGRRRLVSTLQHDPVIVRLLAQHEPFQHFMERLFRVLLGDRDNAKGRTRAAMVASAIGGAVTHPLVADLDDGTLRSELLDLSLRFLALED